MPVIHADASVRFFRQGQMEEEPALALHRFYLSGLPSARRDADDAEPPRKKQRLSGEGQSVALVCVDLDLHLREPAQHRSESRPDAQSAAIEVSIQSVTKTSDRDIDICLISTTSTSSRLEFRASSADVDGIHVDLQRVASLRASSKRSVVWRVEEIAHARCTLAPLEEDRRYGYRLRAEILWELGGSVVNLKGTNCAKESKLALLKAYYPVAESGAVGQWSPQDFYDNVHVPPTDSSIPTQIQGLQCTLYPFQARAVEWLLRREGARFLDGGLVPIGEPTDQQLPPTFTAAEDAHGRRCYISHLQGLVTTDFPSLTGSGIHMRGGILAEEMGLGKTVELVSLICLHRRTEPLLQVVDQYSGSTVTASGATLIITPPSILEQWKSELQVHAPHLRVYHYKGLTSLATKKRIDGGADVSNLLKHDVVLTTYNVLSSEIHYANAAPERNLRQAKRYERRTSPLVQISWWRVCLDEAQMVESGVSQAATVARLIPRMNAWAVSGTPLKKDVQDLLGLLIFLRYEPFCSSRALWQRVNKSIFKEIFGEIALRHTKDKIRHELRLPPQKRVVITVPFTAVEEQNYSQLVQQMCEDCGITTEGAPVTDAFDPDSPVLVEKMRTWLTRLRQTCLHPQVGIRNRRALGRGNGPLRTVGEVLEVMIEQNETVLRAEERQLITAQVIRGHIIANGKGDDERNKTALEIYLAALRKADVLVDECRDELIVEKQKVDTSLRDSIRDAPSANGDETDTDESAADKSGRLAAVRKVLRSALEIQHMCCFFVATAYYQIKTDRSITVPDSEDFHRLERLETEFYDRAKLIRKEMLQETHSRAERIMRKIVTKKDTDRSVELPEIEPLEDLGGIENRRVLEAMDYLTDCLNSQGAQLQEWRQKVMEILLLPLVDEDEGKETTGDEYEDSTKAQDELYIYIAALRAIVADRSQVLTGQANLLIDNETKDAIQQAKAGLGHAPELLLRLMDPRNRYKPGKDEASLRAVISDLRSLATSLQWQQSGGENSRAHAELLIVERELKQVQKIASVQTKAVADLERELELFRTAMNQRLDFYRQLQQISDTVAPYKEELDEVLDHAAVERQRERERISADLVATLRTKRRFLLHLRSESGSQESSRMCIICQSPFEIGVLTVCGHQYCKECIRLWWNEHRTCPVCKRHLKSQDFHNVTYKPQELRAQEEQQSPPSPDRHASLSPQTSIYKNISSSTMDEIKAIDLDGSYGTKIDTIARHILWIREHDPGSKSILFSQYSDFLQVLEGAFRQFKIGFTSIGAKGGIEKFKKDANAECFLLDAKSDASGLNLVNATHVFLCEPLINAAIELQAIARVHRIGQQRPTTVYMYLISDTVEEAIYEISVSRRLAHMGKRANGSRSGSATPALQESAIDAANSLEMQQAPISKLLSKGKSGGEMVEKEDLWSCLFGGPQTRRDAGVADTLRTEVDRHLRGEAAGQRRMPAGAGV